MATILVIDDEEMIRSLAERILTRDSHTVLTAEDGTSAIKLFNENHKSIDIVLVDMLLDDMNGIEILTELRKTAPQIPGIISSGNCYNDDDLPAELNHRLYFLQKPYKANGLTELIDSILTTA